MESFKNLDKWPRINQSTYFSVICYTNCSECFVQWTTKTFDLIEMDFYCSFTFITLSIPPHLIDFYKCKMDLGRLFNHFWYSNSCSTSWIRHILTCFGSLAKKLFLKSSCQSGPFQIRIWIDLYNIWSCCDPDQSDTVTKCQTKCQKSNRCISFYILYQFLCMEKQFGSE